MDAEQHEQAQKWLKEHWRHGPCPVCQNDDWSFYPRLGEISNLNFPLRQIPLLLLGCDTCGYVIPINAIIAGVSAKPEMPAEIAIEVQPEQPVDTGTEPDSSPGDQE